MMGHARRDAREKDVVMREEGIKKRAIEDTQTIKGVATA
jgi:hypothetical protein